MNSGMRSATAFGRFGMGDICDASTGAEKRFRDKSGIWDGATKSRVSEEEDLRKKLIICLTRECGVCLGQI